MTKRGITEVEELSDLVEPVRKASIHGVLTSLSPMKPGKKQNFFEASISDGTAKRRLVGFSSSQRTKLQNYSDAKKPLFLDDCEIKNALRGIGMDVIMKSSTKISPSPKKFNIPAVEFGAADEPKSITLDKIDEMDIYQRVSVTVKVLQVGAENILGNKKMQEVTISDATSTAIVTLWEDHIGQLEKGASYYLTGFTIKEYKDQRYLTMSRVECRITQIDDVGQVCFPLEQAGAGLDTETQIDNARIVGVVTVDEFKICLRCHSRVEPASPLYSGCSKDSCQMLQLHDMCQNYKTAKLLFMAASSNQDPSSSALSQAHLITLTVTNNLLEDMLKGSRVHALDNKEKSLLSLPIFRVVKYDKNYFLTSFQQ